MRRSSLLVTAACSLAVVGVLVAPGSAAGSQPGVLPTLTATATAAPAAAQHVWTELPGRDRPPPSSQEQVYDLANDRIVAVTPGADHQRVDTWVRERGAWREIETANAPSHRTNFALAYDRARDEVVFFGGDLCETCDTGFRDTWVFDGVDWDRKRARPAPPPHGSSREMAYDPVRKELVLYVGVGESIGTPTWTWDGRRWTEHDGAARPADRLAGFTVAWDPSRSEVVLHGGLRFEGADQSVSGQTWAWDGSTWEHVTDGPEAVHHGMATYGGSVVIVDDFEGQDTLQTWILRESTWELLDADVVPAYQPSSEVVPLGKRRLLLSLESVLGTEDHWMLRPRRAG